MKLLSMSFGRKLTALSGAIAVLLTLPLQARAGEWVAAFAPPVGPASPLRIDLPDDLDIMTLTTLGVELDGIDITAMLSLDGTDFVYTPVEPLPAGEHSVRLVDLAQVQEKGSWNFTIDDAAIGDVASAGANEDAISASRIRAAEDWLRGGSVEIDTLSEYSNRILDHNLTDAPNHGILSGAGSVNARTAKNNWQIRARSNYLLQSDHSLALTNNTLDIGEYELSADYSGQSVKGGVTLGHHDIGLSSSLFSGFYRRGASARIGSLNDRITAQGFAFSPQALTGARDFTGLNDSDDRLEGFAGSFKPLAAGQDALTLTGLYYNGNGTDSGIGIAGADVSSDASGWGMVVEKGYGGGRIKWRGEYARSKFDEDGGAGAVPEDKGNAWSLAAEARPFQRNPNLFGKEADIVVGARYDYIDTFFASLANPGLPADREALGAYANLYRDALFAGINLLHERNNVDDRAGLPTDLLRSVDVNLSYSFSPQEKKWLWLGAPYLNLNGRVADMSRHDTPLGYQGSDTNNLTQSMTLGGGTNFASWHWSLSHTLSDFEDHADVSSDTVSHLTGFFAGWTVSDRLDLNGGFQFGTFQDEGNRDTTYDANINLGAAAILIPEKLDLNFDYNLNLASGSGDSPDRHIANGELEYTFMQPKRNRPGLALAVRGSMEDTDGNADSSDDQTQYRVFTVLRVKAPFSFGN